MASAQPSLERCHYYQSESSTQFEKWMADRLFKNDSDQDDSIYVLPVVVHVIHLGDPIGVKENISLDQIESQIRVLNEDFRRKQGTNGLTNTLQVGMRKSNFN